MDNPIDTLVRRIDAHLKRTGKKATNFGIEVRRNPSLVPRLRKGIASVSTIMAVAEYLDKMEKAERRKARKTGGKNGRL